MIKLNHINMEFHGKQILHDINLEVAKGETMVIIGPSGSGKSTILRLIIGLLKPTTGEVLIKGQEISDLPEDQLNKVRLDMGMVFQYSALFDSMTVGGNVAFALREHQKLSESKVQEIVCDKLSLVGLEGYEKAMPAELSGGMKKRVSLARAIAANPPIVLYDEPTSGLDPVISRQIDDLIVKAQKNLGVTSVVVTHDMVSVFRIADRIAMLHNGEVIELSSKEEFKKSPREEVQQFIEYSLGRTGG